MNSFEDPELLSEMEHQQQIERMAKTRKWDVRFMKLAHHVSQWSKDPSTKVGAVVTTDRQVLGLGYNGFPAGTDDRPEFYKDRAIKYPRVVHAEMNALLQTNRMLLMTGREPTLFATLVSCCDCAGPIINFGIKRVVFPYPSEDEKSRWGSSNDMAMQMYKEAGVLVDFLT